MTSSLLLRLERKTASGDNGPARTFLPSLRGRQLVVSIIRVEELLEGAADEAAAFVALQRFAIQGLHLAQARRCALLQRRAARRLGENDAWLVQRRLRRDRSDGQSIDLFLDRLIVNPTPYPSFGGGGRVRGGRCGRGGPAPGGVGLAAPQLLARHRVLDRLVRGHPPGIRRCFYNRHGRPDGA